MGVLTEMSQRLPGSRVLRLPARQVFFFEIKIQIRSCVFLRSTVLRYLPLLCRTVSYLLVSGMISYIKGARF